MEESKHMTHLSHRWSYRLFALMLPLLLLASGCATQQLARKKIVWQSDGQFVTVVGREDRGAEREAANQQPVHLSGSRLRAELAALHVKLPAGSKTISIFKENQLQILGEQIPAGLQQAGADQDLIFAVIDEVPLLMGFAHNDFVTTGRIFYRDNRLNLILGLVREPVTEQDRRLQPFTPGSRLQPANLPGPVTTTSATASFMANRPDWITMALPEGEAEQPVPQAEIPPERKSEKPAAAPAKSGAAQQEKSIEERLRVLGDLRAKGLITEEEYRAKKESILKEL
jgi:hypothetical protein